MTTPLPDARPGGESWQDMTPSPALMMSGGVQHKVIAIREWRNDHGSSFTDWRARCGVEDTTTFAGSLDRAGSSRLRKAACPGCWS